jgi:hypothetical protein
MKAERIFDERRKWKIVGKCAVQDHALETCCDARSENWFPL